MDCQGARRQGSARAPHPPLLQSTSTPAADACAKNQLALEQPGQLTVATDKPAFPPYFEDDDPTNGSPIAREVADQVCVLHEGRIVERGEPERIFSAPEHPETQRFLRRLLDARRL